jgi:hypothetical protein
VYVFEHQDLWITVAEGALGYSKTSWSRFIGNVTGCYPTNKLFKRGLSSVFDGFFAVFAFIGCDVSTS